MIDITVLRAMASAGATVDMILAVVEAAQVCEARKLADKRAKDAERQRISREARARRHTESHNVTVTAVTAETANSPLTKKEDLELKKEKKEIKKERASRIPADWKPSDADHEFAKSKGMPEPRIATEAAKFLNYWKSKSGSAAAKLDWPAVWQNWIMSSLERVPGNPVTGPPSDKPPAYMTPPPGAQSRESILALYRKPNGQAGGTQVRSDARVGENGADKPAELPLSSGGPLHVQARRPSG